MATTTPHSVVAAVVRSVSGRDVERLVRFSGGGMNETYRADLGVDVSVIVRIARQHVPWFGDEAHVSAQAREAGVPVPEVLGVEWLDYDGELLSFSVHRLIPGRSLAELVGELGGAEIESLVVEAGGLFGALRPGERLRRSVSRPEAGGQTRHCASAKSVFGLAIRQVPDNNRKVPDEKENTCPSNASPW